IAWMRELADSARSIVHDFPAEGIQRGFVSKLDEPRRLSEWGSALPSLLPGSSRGKSRSRLGRVFVVRDESSVGLPTVLLWSNAHDAIRVLFRNRRGVRGNARFRLLRGTAGAIMKSSTEQDYKQRIVKTLVYIQEHLDDALELDEIATVAAFSRFHFHRIFRGLVGESVKGYVRRLRLERAARNLKTLDKPITQIALESAFESHESFTRAFGEMFGTSPSAYRAAHTVFPQSPSGAHFNDLGSYHIPDYGVLPPIELKELPAMRLLFLRHVGPYSEVGRSWGR